MSDEEKTSQLTQVDLGDDLLEKTTALVNVKSPAGSVASSSSSSLEETFESASIMMREGFVDEAKKRLRQILIQNPTFVRARKLLAEIHENELKQMVGSGVSSEPPPRISLHRDEEGAADSTDSDDVLRALDRDLGLGLSDELGDGSLAAELSLKNDLNDLAAQDRVDLGIGFMEMGLFLPAVEQFNAACVQLESAEGSLSPEFLAAKNLLARALIQDGKGLEATLTLQSILRDAAAMPAEHRLDCFYLLGRAYESMARPELARLWYQKTAEIDPAYRDVDSRLRGIEA